MRFTIKMKLLLTFGFLILMLIGTAAYSIMTLGNVNNNWSETLSGPAERLRLAQDLNIAVLQQIRQQKNILSAASADETKSYIEKSDAARARFDADLAKVLAKATEQGRVIWDELKDLNEKSRNADDRIRNMILAGDATGAARVSTTEARDAATKIDTLLAKVFDLESGRLQAADVDAANNYQAARNTVVSISAVVSILALISAIWIIISINKGIGRAVKVVQTVADGDLTEFAEISTRDEIGELLGHVNSMIERLRGVVGDALAASDNVSSGSPAAFIRFRTAQPRCHRAGLFCRRSIRLDGGNGSQHQAER